MSDFLKMKCPYCKGDVEYPKEFYGTIFDCPVCKNKITAQTGWDKFTGKFKPKQPKLPKLKPTPNQPIIKPRSNSLAVILFFIGIILIGKGCASDAQNGINEVYQAVQFCAGWIIIGLSMIWCELVFISNKK